MNATSELIKNRLKLVRDLACLATRGRLQNCSQRYFFKMLQLQPQNQVLFTQGDIASLQHFVPATCPATFNELNSVQHIAGTNFPKIFCCTSLKLSIHTT